MFQWVIHHKSSVNGQLSIAMLNNQSVQCTLHDMNSQARNQTVAYPSVILHPILRRLRNQTKVLITMFRTAKIIGVRVPLGSRRPAFLWITQIPAASMIQTPPGCEHQPRCGTNIYNLQCFTLPNDCNMTVNQEMPSITAGPSCCCTLSPGRSIYAI